MNRRVYYDIRNNVGKYIPRHIKQGLDGAIKKITPPRRVVVIGWLGAFNLGDEMMLDVTLTKLREMNYHITLITHKRDKDTINRYEGCKVIARDEINNYSELAKNNDSLLVNGGALLDDNFYETKKTLCYDIAMLAKEFIGKKRRVVFHGLSTNEKIINKAFISDYKFIIKNSDRFSVRDEYSKNVLEKITHQKIKLVDDIALADKVILQRGVGERLKIRPVPSVAFIPILNKQTCPNMEKIIRCLLDLKHVNVKIILFYDEKNNDAHYIEKIHHNIGDDFLRIRAIALPQNSVELFNQLADVESVISMRYHGTLFAGAMKKNTICVEYDNHPHYKNKNTYLKTEYGFWSSSLDASNLSVDNLRELLIQKNQKLTIDTKKIQKRAMRDLNKSIDMI